MLQVPTSLDGSSWCVFYVNRDEFTIFQNFINRNKLEINKKIVCTVVVGKVFV